MSTKKKSGPPLMVMRLRRVKVGVDFRSSEVSMVRDLTLAGEMPANLADRDVLCFVSRSGAQIVFVWRPTERIVRSMRWRLSGGHTWEPLMLADYAREVGIELEGLKTFSEHFAYLDEAVRSATGSES